MITKIRKVVQRLWLKKFAEEYGDDYITVWVNPHRDKLAEYEEIRREIQAVLDEMKALAGDPDADPPIPPVVLSEEQRKALGDRTLAANNGLYAWYADIWSEGEKKMTAEEVREFAIKCEQEDPALWVFMMTETWLLINEHRNRSGKG